MEQITENTIAQNLAQTSEIIVTEEFARALSLIQNGSNVFTHGKPGTGKSCFITFLRSHIYGKGIAVVAPTGLAALNSKGQTIHSFLGLSTYKLYNSKDLKKGEKVGLRKKLRDTDILIIDEASMVRADLFDAMDQKLRDIFDNPVPFAGMQIVLIGDMFQLPPVVKQTGIFDEVTQIDANFIDTYGPQKSFIFNSKAYRQLLFKHVEFTHNFRQDDEEFIKNLDAVRCARQEELPSALNYFNSRCTSALPSNITWLTSTNSTADYINSAKLRALDGEPVITPAIVCRNPVQKRPDNWQDCPQNPLKLKEGAFVMFVKNDEKKRWVNGTTGIIKEISISADGETQHIIVETEEGEQLVERYTWYKLRMTEDGQQAEDPQRSYSQFPLRLAWAVTIHKAQGLTLDKAVIDLGREAFAEGQVYVALSRLRSKNGLYLTRKINPADVKVNAEVSGFLSSVLNK